MKDVFEVQDEIARSIAEALRITLSPQEQAALAAKPTENLQAYDLYLRGKNYARRMTRQDLEFALQMFENAVSLDPNFALAYAAIANVCAQTHYNYGRDPIWLKRAEAASQRAVRLQPHLPEVLIAQAWILYAAQNYEDAIHCAKQAVDRKRDCEGAYYLLCRLLFASGRYQELVNVADTALEASGEDYNCYVPITNALAAMGKQEALRNTRQRMAVALENHLKQVPEDARARILVSTRPSERPVARLEMCRLAQQRPPVARPLRGPVEHGLHRQIGAEFGQPPAARGWHRADARDIEDLEVGHQRITGYPRHVFVYFDIG